MRPPLSLVVLLLSSAVQAGVSKPAVPAEPASKAAEEPRYYDYTNKNNARIDEVVGRKDIYLPDDMGAGALHELCLIPPAADWITEGAPPEIEHKYLNLIWRAAYAVNQAQGKGNYANRTVGTCGVDAYSVISGAADMSNYAVGAFDEEIKKRTRFSSCLMSRYPVKGAPKYASYGNKSFGSSVAIIETLNLLLKSRTPDTVRDALGDVRQLQNSDKFRDAIEALVRDKSLTAKVEIAPDNVKETVPLRVLAMRTLATIERTERSAKLLALVWHDEKEPEEIREGALRSFAFVVQWPGPAALTAERHRPAMHKALYQFIVPIMGILDDEDEKRGASSPKKKLSALGSAAQCAVDMWPRKIQLKARKGKRYDDPD